MFYNLSPEEDPPVKDNDNIVRQTNFDIALDEFEEDSDVEELPTRNREPVEMGYYQVLQEFNDENIDQGSAESDDEDESDSNGDHVHIIHSTASADGPSSSNSESPSSKQQPIETPVTPTARPDIKIDAELIKSVMSNISLPVSSFPEWIDSVPQSQWSNILNQQIERSSQSEKKK